MACRLPARAGGGREPAEGPGSRTQRQSLSRLRSRGRQGWGRGGEEPGRGAASPGGVGGPRSRSLRLARAFQPDAWCAAVRARDTAAARWRAGRRRLRGAEAGNGGSGSRGPGRRGTGLTSRSSPSGLVHPAGGRRRDGVRAAGAAGSSFPRQRAGRRRAANPVRRRARAAEPQGPAVRRAGSDAGCGRDIGGLLPERAADRMEAKTLGIATPRKPVLSVSARKIKDNAADWHNLILKWESLSDAGFTTASNIANLKVSLLEKDKIELASSTSASCEEGEKPRLECYKELEALCEELQATLDGLTKVQVKMEKLSSTTKGVCELENYHYGEENERPLLFHTWPTTHFYEVSCQLSDMYSKELLLKRTIGAELAHTADRNLALSYLSMWLHQPYVESSSKLHLESMLLETGHRAL